MDLGINSFRWPFNWWMNTCRVHQSRLIESHTLMSQTTVNKCWEVYDEKEKSLEKTQSIAIEEEVLGPQPRKDWIVTPRTYKRCLCIMSLLCESFPGGQDHMCEWWRAPCLWQRYTKDRWFRAVYHIHNVCFPEYLDHSTNIILANLLTSLLEREFQRLLSLVLKLPWLKASGRLKAGSGIQGFWIPCQSSSWAAMKINTLDPRM